MGVWHRDKARGQLVNGIVVEWSRVHRLEAVDPGEMDKTMARVDRQRDGKINIFKVPHNRRLNWPLGRLKQETFGGGREANKKKMMKIVDGGGGGSGLVPQSCFRRVFGSAPPFFIQLWDVQCLGRWRDGFKMLRYGS
ncbi:uncharacterized protein LOC120417549 [Culex pipiens pallens]|uniref:uncharacterized protein LOC120417549 n=1 Tax=Culex pipiens pallens TaxID=42434 RepID=UPI001953A89E|nr:uncharacterized protein LOC120417549 [Culex pipiens pallens]